MPAFMQRRHTGAQPQGQRYDQGIALFFFFLLSKWFDALNIFLITLKDKEGDVAVDIVEIISSGAMKAKINLNPKVTMTNFKIMTMRVIAEEVAVVINEAVVEAVVEAVAEAEITDIDFGIEQQNK